MNFYVYTYPMVITITQFKVREPFQHPAKSFMSLPSQHLPPSKVTTILISFTVELHINRVTYYVSLVWFLSFTMSGRHIQVALSFQVPLLYCLSGIFLGLEC